MLKGKRIPIQRPQKKIDMFLFEYLGAFYKWLFLWVVNLFYKKSSPSFDRILHPEIDENTGEIFDILSNGLSNKVVGFIVTMILCSILVKIK